jgi:hypothetical protein
MILPVIDERRNSGVGRAPRNNRSTLLTTYTNPMHIGSAPACMPAKNVSNCRVSAFCEGFPSARTNYRVNDRPARVAGCAAASFAAPPKGSGVVASLG